MSEQIVLLAFDAFTRWTNLARRLAMPVEEVLAAVAARSDLLDTIATALVQPAPFQEIPPVRLRPETPISDEIATITISGNAVRTLLPHRHEWFVDVVIRLRYEWVGGCWQRVIPRFAEPVADRAVELGVHLLAAGFVVEPPASLAERIQASGYTPETRCWVKRRIKGKYFDWFEITWDKDGRDYCRDAGLIHGSHCYPGTVLAPAASFDEVLDFARANGFAVSDGALDLVGKARAQRDATLFAAPAIRKPARPVQAEPAPVPEGILDELADEPL